LEKRPDKIDWLELSRNPNAIHLLENNLDKINWYWLSRNPNAIHILENNPDKIHWPSLSENPSIFNQSYDYPKIKSTIGDRIREPLVQALNHPKRVSYMVEKYYTGDYGEYWDSTTL
jgi:hypothetical protein